MQCHARRRSTGEGRELGLEVAAIRDLLAKADVDRDHDPNEALGAGARQQPRNRGVPPHWQELSAHEIEGQNDKRSRERQSEVCASAPQAAPALPEQPRQRVLPAEEPAAVREQPPIYDQKR